MAPPKTVNAANLEALGPACLAALLLELGTEHPAIKRRLRLAIAGNAGPAEAAVLVAKRLAGIASSRSFLDAQKTRALALDLQAQRRAILDLVAPADPREAFELVWRLIGCAGPILGRSHDGSRHLGAVFQDAQLDLGRLAQATRLDPASLAQRAFEVICSDTHNVCHELVPTLAEPLGTAGLDVLQSLMQAWQSTPVQRHPEGQRQAVGWSSVSGEIFAGDLEAARRQTISRRTLLQIADLLGDVDGYVAQFDGRARRMPTIAADIARRLLQARRTQDALDALEAAERGAHGMPLEWEQVLLGVLEALGRSDEAQAIRWECFAATLEASHLRDVMKRLPDFEDFEAEQRGLDLALAFGDVHRALAFLVGWPDLSRANRLVLDRTGELDGDLYALLSPAADMLQDRHPLAATLLRRAMIDFTLGAGRSARYGHAARHLAECAAAAPRIEDYGAAPDHAAYERFLRADHGAKTAFWLEVT